MATTANNGWTIPVATDYVKDGYAAIDTLGNAIDTSVGKGLLAWQAWTPTMTGWTGAGTWLNTLYCQIGKTVILTGRFQPTSTTGIGAVTITLPITGKYLNVAGGNVLVTAGGGTYIGGCRMSSTTAMVVYAYNAGGTYLTPANFSSTIPGTWASSGDQFSFILTYEAA